MQSVSGIMDDEDIAKAIQASGCIRILITSGSVVLMDRTVEISSDPAVGELETKG